MADEVQKLPYALSLNKLIQGKILAATWRKGMALPCKVVDVAGSIVTVSFEVDTTLADGTVVTLPNVTVPSFGPEYIRYPTQVGDLGVVFPASVRLGGITGLGAGLAKLFSTPGNLSTLIFFPVASKNWSPTDDPNSLVMYGPDGVVLRDANKKSVFTLTVGGITIVLQSGDALALTGNLAVTGNITATGSIVAGFGGADQVGVQTHEHPTAATGAPSPPTAGT